MSVLLGEVEEADYEDDSTLTHRSHPLYYLTYTSTVTSSASALTTNKNPVNISNCIKYSGTSYLSNLDTLGVEKYTDMAIGQQCALQMCYDYFM